MQTKHIPKKLTLALTNENGYVEFLNLPKVDKNGAVIAYDLREDAHTPNSPKATDRTAIDIVKKQKSGTTPPTLETTQTFTDGDRHYNYTGTAKYVAAEETIGGTSKTYPLNTTSPTPCR